MASKKQFNSFTTRLLDWHFHENKREIPWKKERDPYKIWLSEIMLQQTRLEQGIGYYQRFIEAFPTIYDLAKAEDQTVFKLWEGLGYYSRCRNLLETARTIVLEQNGSFPDTYPEILQLKGIGPYTAAAIASFAFNLPYAVVDGNVVRVLSRFFMIHEVFNSPSGKRVFQELANSLLDPKNPGYFNQAIMDFGATICKPQNPACSICPLSIDCKAFKDDLVLQFPVKIKKAPKTHRYFHYALFWVEDKVWIQERTQKDVWRHLYEFYGLESNSKEEWQKIRPEKHPGIPEDSCTSFQKTTTSYGQHLTHQFIQVFFSQFFLRTHPDWLPKEGLWVGKSDLKKYPFPKLFNDFLKDKGFI